MALSRSTLSRSTLSRSTLSSLAAIGATTGLLLGGASAQAAAPVSGVTDHLSELQQIANNNNGNRAAGTSGYQGSVDYVSDQLSDAGFDVDVQEFTYRSRRGGTARSYNVIAETTTGDATNTVMVGGHLDSVTRGPGINDNGSGSAAVLQTALDLGGSPGSTNKVRFAFWGAEELGLKGSTAYVNGLSRGERSDIAMYLNFDMLGSPNAGYFVYDGDDSDSEGRGPGPDGSAEIESDLQQAMSDQGVETEGTDFDGRSDYGPFIRTGIPAGGYFSGAEGRMSSSQARKWDGEAGQNFDRCYHSRCDTIDNVNRDALTKHYNAITSVVQDYAQDTGGI